MYVTSISLSTADSVRTVVSHISYGNKAIIERSAVLWSYHLGILSQCMKM